MLRRVGSPYQGHRIAMKRRAGEDDDGDRDCVLVVRAYDLRGKNKRKMCLETKGGGKVSFTNNAAGQVYKQTIELCTWAGLPSQTEALALK